MRRLGRVLLFALVAGLAGLAAVGPPRRSAAQGGDVPALLAELQRAWTAGDAAGVTALFAPEAVIRTQPADSKGTGLYLDGFGPASLGLGVRTLLGGAALGADERGASGPAAVLRRATDGATQIDVAGGQTAEAVLDGAPAVLVRWTYTRAGTAPGPAGGALPPETGTDEVVLRGGRITAYTRTPDLASVRARDQVLVHAAAAQLDPAPADRGPAAPPPNRPAAGAGPWLLATGGILVGVILLARVTRPPEPEARPGRPGRGAPR